MNFDISEFLDSLSGLTRTSASRRIQSEMETLDKFNRRPKPVNSKVHVEHRTYTREYNFLENLSYELRTGGKSEVKKADREVLDEVLKTLKYDTPLKVIKKTSK